ncbi:Zinc transporter ZIP14 [Eumeta japonica]|uniref:Zinc transporter ZIP14 n=1 Tax=Eumeta variegata TaxID=151549 RepID=A0A4C1XWF2_EUMVA|nr:Zinc transporter ZIP14 [Eumeta japonica]
MLQGFEHLLDSLGLGGRVFNSPHDIALHRVNGTFRQLHDTQHRHRRSPASTTGRLVMLLIRHYKHSRSGITRTRHGRKQMTGPSQLSRADILSMSVQFRDYLEGKVKLTSKKNRGAQYGVLKARPYLEADHRLLLYKAQTASNLRKYSIVNNLVVYGQLDPLALRRDVTSLCMSNLKHRGDCAKELLNLIPAAGFRQCPARRKYSQHHLDRTLHTQFSATYETKVIRYDARRTVGVRAVPMPAYVGCRTEDNRPAGRGPRRADTRLSLCPPLSYYPPLPRAACRRSAVKAPPTKLRRKTRDRHFTTAEPILQKSCLSPKEILEVYGMENEPGVITIKPNTFLEMCPALVYQLDQKSCYKTEAPAPKLEKQWTWIYASLSILVISATGLVGVAVVPLLKSKAFGHVLQFLVAVAVGTLCGDALLHLLPHALKMPATPGPASPSDDETRVVLRCSVTFLTILLFYTVEAVMQTLHGGHSHDHSHNDTTIESKVDSSKQIEPIELGAMMPGAPPPPTERPMTSTALMVIMGDGLHNLTDGLAIGAAFSGDPVTGFATALAVFCHELPHELGDFAVLLRSGMSIRRALYYNLLSSVLSFMGMAGGIWLAEDHESASQWIYAATAGTFLYIALADLVPEINHNIKGHSLSLLLAVLGILAGGVIMLLIALHEDSIQYLFRNAEE